MKIATINDVRVLIETAAYVDHLLPPVRAPKYRCLMPDIIYTPQEIALMDKRPLKVRPTREQVSIWEMVTLEWLPVLTLEERKLVWKRANHIPWKLLCRDFGLCKSNLSERHAKALLKIKFFVIGLKKCPRHLLPGHNYKKRV